MLLSFIFGTFFIEPKKGFEGSKVYDLMFLLRPEDERYVFNANYFEYKGKASACQRERALKKITQGLLTRTRISPIVAQNH